VFRFTVSSRRIKGNAADEQAADKIELPILKNAVEEVGGRGKAKYCP